MKGGMASLVRRFLGREERLADWLPWRLPLDDDFEVILTDAGGLLRIARLDAPDMESASTDALITHHDRLVQLFARLGFGVSVYLDHWRLPHEGGLPPSDFGGIKAAQLIDASRRRQFMDRQRPVFSGDTFCGIHYVPPIRDKLLGLLRERNWTAVAGVVNSFKENTETVMLELAYAMHGVEVLRDHQLASYLESTVSFRPRKVSRPRGFIAPQLAAVTWKTVPRVSIDGRHIATVEVIGWGSPNPKTMLTLYALSFPWRWTTTFHCLDPADQRAQIRKVRADWVGKQIPLVTHIERMLTKNRFVGRTNPEADRAIAQLEQLQGELAERPFALATCNVHVWGDTEAEAADRAMQVAGALNAGEGLLAREADWNSALAPIADMPGNVTGKTANQRRNRIELAAITRLSPVTGVSAGSREDRRFDGPALTLGLTRRGQPFYWAMNAPGSDVPHVVAVGKTGSGKSCFLSYLVAQFMRYLDARAIVFDRRGSFKVCCLALGGDWLDPGAGGVGVQPLRNIHIPAEFTWAEGWTVGALKKQGLPINPAAKDAVTQALRGVVELPPEHRTLTALHSCLGADDMARKALMPYLAGQGPYGELFDGVVASYGSAPVVGVETLRLSDLKDVADPFLDALFHALDRERMTGEMPKLLVVDEYGITGKNERFDAAVEDWSLENRKLKAALVLATQSLLHFDTPRGKAILAQIPNKLLFPEEEAEAPINAEAYEEIGLLPEQISLLRYAAPKNEHLLKTETVTKLVSYRLEGEALALCGSSSPEDQARADELLAAGVRPGAEFTDAWLSETTADWLKRKRLRLVA